MARAFIPDRGNADPTSTSYGRTFFGAIVKQAHVLNVKDVGELYRLLTAAKREELQILVEGTPAAPFVEAGNEKFFRSVLATTSDHTKCLEYICAQRSSLFSVRDWIKSGTGVLFLLYQADQVAALKTVISTWMRLAIFQTLSSREADHRIWFAVDELDALGPIDGLSDALAKFGGRCALGFQAISEESNTYGQGLAQAMVENCGTSLVLRCSSSENGGTSRFACAWLVSAKSYVLPIPSAAPQEIDRVVASVPGGVRKAQRPSRLRVTRSLVTRAVATACGTAHVQIASAGQAAARLIAPPIHCCLKTSAAWYRFIFRLRFKPSVRQKTMHASLGSTEVEKVAPTKTNTARNPRGQSLQDPFFEALRRERIPVSIFLVNGIKLLGQIDSFDQFSVMLKNATNQVIFKHAISTIAPGSNFNITFEAEGTEDSG